MYYLFQLLFSVQLLSEVELGFTKITLNHLLCFCFLFFSDTLMKYIRNSKNKSTKPVLR